MASATADADAADGGLVFARVSGSFARSSRNREGRLVGAAPAKKLARTAVASTRPLSPPRTHSDAAVL